MRLSVPKPFFSFPMCATQKASPPHPPTATVKQASDWQGVGLGLRSFCCWPQLRQERIDKWLLTKYGRVQSAPLTSSESLLISIMLCVYRGPIRPLAVGWAASQGPWGRGLTNPNLYSSHTSIQCLQSKFENLKHRTVLVPYHGGGRRK
jgi:hypothetical protein